MVKIPKSIRVGDCKIYPPLTKINVWLTRFEPLSDETRKTHCLIGVFKTEFEARSKAKAYAKGSSLDA